MKYKYILFDLDGTLLDTTCGVIKAVKITLQQEHLVLNEDLLPNFVGPPMQESMMKYFNVDKDTGLKLANIFRKNYKEYCLFDASIYNGIIDVLEILKHNNIKLAIATNKSHNNANDIIEHFKLDKYFDYVLGSDLEGKLTKSDIINICIKKLNANNMETALIGDSKYDAIGAYDNNIDFLAVLYGFDLRSKMDLQDITYKHSFKDTKEIYNYFKEKI